MKTKVTLKRKEVKALLYAEMNIQEQLADDKHTHLSKDKQEEIYDKLESVEEKLWLKTLELDNKMNAELQESVNKALDKTFSIAN